MTTLNELRSQADEIAAAGHAGWGNTMRDAADEIDRLRTEAEAVAADIRIENDKAVIAGLTAERDELRKSLADRDAKLSELHLQYISDFGQLQAQEPAAMYLRECADGSLVQLYDDLKPGTKLYAAAERDALQAKYTEACQHVVKVECDHGTTLGELAELRAKLAALETHNTMLRACLKGVIRVADRKTDEFDAARAALGEQP